MKIVFDCRYTRFDRYDGISRYTAGLVGALGAAHPVIMLISDYRQLAMLPELPWELVSAPTGIREPLVARQVNRLKPDVVFTPMQTMGSWGRRYRLVSTVHDLIYYRHRTPPRDLPWAIRLLWRLYHLAWWPQRMLLNRVDAVVTVSETTRALIAEHKLTRKPVTVVPNAAGTASAVQPDAADPANSVDPERDATPLLRRLVYMGSFMPYKNVDTLVRAAALLPGYELHLMSAITRQERQRLSAIDPDARLVFHNGTTDEEYHETLRRATALVTASLDEGFGIPLLESMSLGIPVVVSDIPIFREIGSDAASFFDPHDPNQLVSAVQRLEEPGVWAARSTESRRQARRYTWSASALKLLTMLEEVAGASASSPKSGRRRLS